MEIKKQELIKALNLLMGATGMFIILLGVSFILEIQEYLIYLLIVMGVILLIWKSILERNLEKSK